MQALVKYIRPSAKTPERSTNKSVGFIFYASLDHVRSLTPGHRIMVGTGIAIVPPEGMYLHILPLGDWEIHGIDISSGVIEPNDESEIKILMINHSKRSFVIRDHQAICQGVFCPLLIPELIKEN
jgi:dUTPase